MVYRKVIHSIRYLSQVFVTKENTYNFLQAQSSSDSKTYSTREPLRPSAAVSTVVVQPIENNIEKSSGPPPPLAVNSAFRPFAFRNVVVELLPLQLLLLPLLLLLSLFLLLLLYRHYHMIPPCLLLLSLLLSFFLLLLLLHTTVTTAIMTKRTRTRTRTTITIIIIDVHHHMITHGTYGV